MTIKPVVSNAGPLIALAAIGHLDLLESLYARVLVPEAVLREVTQAGAMRVGAREVASAAYLEYVIVEPPPEPLLAKELGTGEAHVITLAQRLGAQLTILDERRARRIAEQAYGLRIKGSAGLLVSAKRRGLIPSVRPLLDDMVRHGYFLSPRLIERAAAEAGE